MFKLDKRRYLDPSALIELKMSYNRVTGSAVTKMEHHI